MSSPPKTRLFWRHDQPGEARKVCPNQWVQPEAKCATCGRTRLSSDLGRVDGQDIHTRVYEPLIHTSNPRRNVWISEETSAQLERLGVVNLSAYLRRKVEEDARQSSPLKNLRAELEAKREEIRALEHTFESKALETEDVLKLFEKAAGQARNVISHKDSKVSAQTSLLLWVRNHPTGHKLRELLPADFSEQQLADVLLRWPESKTEVQVLVEAGP